MIKSIGEETNDWRALDTWLQRSFPADYRRDASINVKAEANAASASQLVLGPEKRRELQKRLARLRAKTDKAAGQVSPAVDTPVSEPKALKAVEPAPNPLNLRMGDWD
jgi:hypothetical protein